MQNIRLTSYSHGGGCGCKISPAVLKTIVGTVNNLQFSNLLVGFSSNDDAAVLDMGNDSGLISTTDFFMPIVDDAFAFGQIAAANAISDVYAMGGTPLLSIAILGWPVEKLPAELAHEVLNGARLTCENAGIPLAGGHSIDSPEPVFGLAVSGTVRIKHLKRNNTAKKGDLLFLTKPLGFGIITTAAKRNQVQENDLLFAINQMKSLNKIGEELGKHAFINAMTDVTGFGLLGHCIEMAEGSGLTAELDFSKLTLLPNLFNYIEKNIYPNMTMKNYSTYSNKVNELDAARLFVSCDPQTSGGLLVAVCPDKVDAYIEIAKKYISNPQLLQPIGSLSEASDKVVVIK